MEREMSQETLEARLETDARKAERADGELRIALGSWMGQTLEAGLEPRAWRRGGAAPTGGPMGSKQT